MKISKRELTSNEVQRLSRACDTLTNKGKRDLAILDTMLYQGLKVSEVANLRLADFIYREDTWVIQLSKKRKAPIIKVHTMLLQSLNLWLCSMNLRIGDTIGPVYYQVDKKDRVLQKTVSARAISRIVARYGFEVGLAPLEGPDKLNSNDLRRTCAMNAYKNGASILGVQYLLGYHHTESVARFLGLESDPEVAVAVDYVKYYE